MWAATRKVHVVDESDEEFSEDALELFEQDGPDLFGSASPALEELPDDADAQSPEVTAALMGAVDARRLPTNNTTRPDTPLALYRRYRPDTFAEVIGQEHVTEPLQRALANNRVNHAYLFSGPRGCGKTTSARILARCLNCEQGPTTTPCGVCQSCRDLARGGAGSIDVIEIDAASHGGVDDARDLRERAFFAPVHSRYKIYIIDEAHMVTPQGFNALLKVVEEPPPHVRFIFATTEPDKVLGTIRSRTHHYPFRLVPPKTLSAYLATLCEAEGIAVEPAVLPLVVRAGAGSVRDSLSVLDQLLGGASESGVSYAQATALLGYTPDALLDEIVDAFAAGDAQGVFAAVDKVIEVGQDPRRFAEDLLRRLRDLIIVAAVPEALSNGLVDVAGDQAERLAAQASALGAGELTRAAEVIAVGLTEMRGTTAPRLHLELMCARVLLPGADVDGRGLHARLDRLERRVGIDGELPAAARPAARPVDASEKSLRQAQTPTTEPDHSPVAEPVTASAPAPETGSRRQAAMAQVAEEAAQRAEAPASVAPAKARPEPAKRRPAAAEPVTRTAAQPETASPAAIPEPSAEPSATSVPAPVTPAAPEPAPAQGGRLSGADLRRLWPEILENVKHRRRFTWILLSQNAQVVDVRNDVLTLGLANTGAKESFARGGNSEVLREAILEVIGAAFHIELILDATADAPKPAAAAPAPAAASPTSPERAAMIEEARANIRPTRSAPSPSEPPEEEVEPDRDDEVVDTGDASGEELLMKHLGAELLGDES